MLVCFGPHNISPLSRDSSCWTLFSENTGEKCCVLTFNACFFTCRISIRKIIKCSNVGVVLVPTTSCLYRPCLICDLVYLEKGRCKHGRWDNYYEKGMIFLVPGAPEIPGPQSLPVLRTGQQFGLPVCSCLHWCRILRMMLATVGLIVCGNHRTELKKLM